MTELEEFNRITRTPGIMGGKPCIRGMRVTVGMIVGQIGAGATVEEMLDHFPYLQRDDIMQAIQYAGWLASNMKLLDPLPSGEDEGEWIDLPQ
ncbi:MAG: DUF433 domain-containing protein [Aestuariivirga sp.]